MAKRQKIPPRGERMNRLVSVSELAEHCGVTPRTVRNWLDKGAAARLHIGPTARVRITAEDARKLSGGTWPDDEKRRKSRQS